MARARDGLGLAAGVFLVLSALAHSLLGGRELSQELAAAAVPPDLARGVLMGWHFGGIAMLAFGLIAIGIFFRRLRGEALPAFPAAVIGGCYLVFAASMAAIHGFDSFLFVFIAPGILLVVAGWGVAARC